MTTVLASPVLLRAQTVDPQAEQEMVRLVNRERQSRGLATLAVDEHLREAARAHSRLMAESGEVEHRIGNEKELQLRLTGLRFDTSGENVALNRDAERAHDALMHSPGHRANILDADYNTIGIGVIRTAQGIYITEDFAHRLPEMSVEAAESEIANRINRMRREAGVSALPLRPAPELRAKACGMAERNRLDPRAGLISRAVSNSIVFTASDLSKLPESVERLRTQPATAFSVGACYQASKSYAVPVFWFIVVTYQ